MLQVLDTSLVITKNSTGKQRAISKIKEFSDENGTNVFYVANYENNGFVIMSADKRVNPILAYSDDHNFDLDTECFAPGLSLWLNQTKDVIKKVRHDNKEAVKWDLNSMKEALCNISTKVGETEETRPEPHTHATVYKKLDFNVNWGQCDGYNDLLADASCKCSYNGRYPTGCVTTAVAQIMRHYKYPNRYNWDSMPLTHGSASISTLMKDLLNSMKVGTGDYSCDGTSINLAKAEEVFKDWGYKNVKTGDFNFNTAKSEILANRPVFLGAWSKSNTSWIFFTKYTGGHAWVCSGYRNSVWCSPGKPNEGCFEYWTEYFYMNWGWNEVHSTSVQDCNGWYSTWKPNDKDPETEYSDYQYNKKMIYNIYPL